MPDELNLQKLKEEYPEVFKKIPANITKVLLSEETPSQVSDICFKNGVRDEKRIERVAYWITLVLLGGLSMEDFTETIEEELKINFGAAKKIQDEANRLIFSQVKDDLANLYGVGVKTTPKLEEKPKRPQKKDIYKEPIE
ncbi:MAG: hypothetical protein COT59_00890 [Candidatus Nealsonbacteria bacterium CG09_land_8_20_14_0_10_42_14]|uniref:Uncharacterized protein n=1 Tax=Candidatus Nealsonbacteria bacterium CG09_land_8_20_14_0_10_42_14 TaxID=1974707 RepID=A0A2H0WXQ5_9BACT|nr:MAG: hypothetical protein COT59_00890 [Candidatus Nealsonbacteria bacterium CG09_land_8_20_14_0_10_42_14]